jgi:hypothetical protein
MTAIWTTPKTWVTGDPLTASDLNTHVRDNLDYLKSPPTTLYQIAGTSDYTTTSTAFTDVDGTNLALAITTAGGDVLIFFSGIVLISSATNYVYFDLSIDGVLQGGANGLLAVKPGTAGASQIPIVIPFLKQGLGSGTHTIKLQWKVDNGSVTATFKANSAGIAGQMKPQSAVREVS